MTVRHSGVATRVQAVARDTTWEHCSIHREALATKGKPDNLKDVLDTTVKMVNFDKARPLNSHVFSAVMTWPFLGIDRGFPLSPSLSPTPRFYYLRS